MSSQGISPALRRAGSDPSVQTPAYIFDTAAIRAAAQRMLDAWRQEFPLVTLAYSYKTNPLPLVTGLLRDIGCAAEVVSGAELDAALADGYPGDRIWLDGPVKTPAELARALEVGAHIQIDSLDELRSLLSLLPAHPVASPAAVSLRAAVRKRRSWSRFGLLPDELAEARRIARSAGLAVRGLHFNTGAHAASGRPYLDALDEHAQFIDVLARESDPVMIDIGGGFPARSAEPGYEPPPPSDYATAVARWFDQRRLDRKRVHLVIEPGRSLVEDHAVLVAAVAVRKQRKRMRIVVLDGGTNLVRSITSWHHPIEFVRQDGVMHDYAIYGSLCYESDLFAEAVRGPLDIAIGDRVVVGSAGGYDIPSANVWSRPKPPIYVVDGALSATVELWRGGGTDIR